jgi:hypothetical protein
MKQESELTHGIFNDDGCPTPLVPSLRAIRVNAAFASLVSRASGAPDATLPSIS